MVYNPNPGYDLLASDLVKNNFLSSFLMYSREMQTQVYKNVWIDVVQSELLKYNIENNTSYKLDFFIDM